MIFNWKNIFRFRKVQVISLELTETGVRFHFSRLKYGKAKVKVLTEFENISKDVLLKELSYLQPILIHVHGKGVINKTLSLEEVNLNDMVMSANPNDFYINQTNLGEHCYISFTRRTLVDEVLSLLEHHNDNIIDIVIGPYHVLIDEIRLKAGTTPLGDIKKENGIYQFKQPNPSQQTLFNGALYQDSYFAVTLGTAYLLNKLSASALNKIEKNQKKSNFVDKLQFSYISIFALSFFLLALLTNYFYQGYINKKNTDLEAKIMVYSNNLNKIDLIDQELQRKKQLIANSGIIRSNYFSITLDELGASVPLTIQLDEIEIYPLEKKLKENVKPLFNEKAIKVSGTAKSSENIDLWIKTLNSLSWVDNVAILNFTVDENKRIAFFELKITEK